VRIAAVLLGCAVVAGSACGEWARTASLGTNATPSPTLQAYRLVNNEVAAFPGAAGTRAAAVDTPAREALGAELRGRALGSEDLGSVPAVAAWNTGAVFGEMPAYLLSDFGKVVPGAVNGFTRVDGSTLVNTNRVPAFLAVLGVASCEVDPLLALVDLWECGPLGDLRRAANLARARGDTGAYDKMAREYWRTMDAAMERRETLGGRGKRARAAGGT